MLSTNQSNDIPFCLIRIADHQQSLGRKGRRLMAFNISSTPDAAVEHALGSQIGQRLAQRFGVDMKALGQSPLARQLADQLARRDSLTNLLPQPLKLITEARLLPP